MAKVVTPTNNQQPTTMIKNWRLRCTHPRYNPLTLGTTPNGILGLAALLGLCIPQTLAQTSTSATTASAGTNVDTNACIPAHQFIELLPAKIGGYTNDYHERTAPLGMYERISPNGRYILRSFSGNKLGDVTVLELPDRGFGSRWLMLPNACAFTARL